MFNSVYDLKNFYAAAPGRLVRRLVHDRVREIWPDVSGLRLVGHGYALPYLRGLMDGAERTIALMPAPLGVHAWPEKERGLTALADEESWPIETESVDRLLLVHSLDQVQAPEAVLREAWRVLRSSGRLLIIVPNRMGLWARADWTPFGHGRPYSMRQIGHYLRDAQFVHERTERALFMPPFRRFLVLRGAYGLEGVGRVLSPALAGLYLVEASKQIYAGVGRVRPEREARRGMVPDAAAIPTARVLARAGPER